MSVTDTEGSDLTSPALTTKYLSRVERQASGRALRQSVPRSSHAEWSAPAHRSDPIDLLELSSHDRLSHLVKIRYGRMCQSPYAFLRGAPIVMAADLATTPTTSMRVQTCGDCHLLNFGCYGTPERNFVFDLNDFDETFPGPWEWDTKRLATSIVLAGRLINLSDKHCEAAARSAACAYRKHMSEYAQMSALEVWYSRVEADMLLDVAESSKYREQLEKGVRKASTRSSSGALPKLTEIVDGERRIIDDPPLMYHLSVNDPLEKEAESVFLHYRETLRDELHILLDRYHLVDIAFKAVGVGSVGTRCAIALLMAGDNDPLFLQMKEARASVLEPYLGQSNYPNHGQRIVAGQRMMQAASDIFLGWTQSDGGHDFYVRQLRDMKTSVDVEAMSASDLINYAALCGWILARAHARTGDAVMLSGYLGKKETFDRSIATFALTYADQTKRDHQALLDAVQAGRLKAVEE